MQTKECIELVSSMDFSKPSDVYKASFAPCASVKKDLVLDVPGVVQQEHKDISI